ncbi:MAG: TlpA disulfide reductase family protein [Bacteroidota bacterium]
MRLLPLLLLFLSACTFVQDRYPELPPGPYRAVLKLENNPITPNPKGQPLPEKMNLEFEEVTDGELPFNFTVTYENDSTYHLDIQNGDELIRVPAENIHYGRDLTQARDTIRIDFPIYDSYISAYHEESIIEGVWVVNYRDQYRIPFVAKFGQNHRFTQLKKEPMVDLSGEWAMEFSGGNEDTPYPGLAEFQQNGNDLRGTIRTETGDYRYLAGTIQANKFYLSVFDGSHAFLFEGMAEADGTLNGSFRSGRHYITGFTAQRSSDFALANPDSLTVLREDRPLSFAFPTIDGDTVSLEDERYTDRVKLVQIMGTSCPNCKDETNYLKAYQAEHPEQDFDIITLAFERYGPDDERSKKAIQRFIDRMKIEWPVLLAGTFNKKKAGEALPMLNHVLSFPTLLFLDGENKVVRIHTGFNGPATSKFAEFDASFKATMAALTEKTSK